MKRTTRSLLTFLFAAMVAVSTSYQSNAGVFDLDGKTVTLDVFQGDMNTITDPLGDAVVGAGVEFPGLFDGFYDVDISSTQFIANNFVSPGFFAGSVNGWRLSDTDTAFIFTSATVSPSNTLAGLDNSMISFDDHNLYINVGGTSFDTSTEVIVDVTISPIPEPTTFTLLGLGSLALVLARRRRL